MNILSNSKYIDLYNISTSGQAFRFLPINKSKTEFTTIYKDTVIYLEQENNKIFYQTYPKENQIKLVENYFRTDVDFKELEKELGKDEFIYKAYTEIGKLWLLKQDPWETIISFVLSINKNFPHIQICIDNLCKKYGEEIKTPYGIFYQFPTPEILSKENVCNIRSCKVGFRDKYVKKISEFFAKHPNKLLEINKFKNSEVKIFLTSLYGIGDKVADCVLLFAYARDDQIPFDVWVKRIMVDLYNQPNNSTYEDLSKFASNYFNKYTGWIQQYLFMYARSVHQKGKSLKETWRI